MAFVLTNSNFETEVLNSDKPVLVDFGADWCGPCKMLAPIIEELSNEVDDVKIGKLNTDENPDIARQYGIMSIPTMIIFKNGNIADTIVGFHSKNDLLEILSKI